tara:strand:- start:36 stop:245 length:210 start_codon:yes stop_codon:yes gene_type:complete
MIPVFYPQLIIFMTLFSLPMIVMIYTLNIMSKIDKLLFRIDNGNTELRRSLRLKEKQEKEEKLKKSISY